MRGLRYLADGWVCYAGLHPEQLKGQTAGMIEDADKRCPVPRLRHKLKNRDSKKLVED